MLDIVSVFAGKLVIDNWAPFDDFVASVFVGNASVFASKLDIDALQKQPCFRTYSDSENLMCIWLIMSDT